MKKIGIVLAVLALAALAIPVANLAAGGPRDTSLTKDAPEDPALRKVAAILEGPCADCHVEGVKAPWYAALPVASGLIAKDRAVGMDWLDLHEALAGDGKDPSEPGLAKVEQSLKVGEMPPARYVALHWNAALKAADRDAVLAWIRDVRATRFAPEGLPRDLAAQVIHPLPASVAVNWPKAVLGQRLYHDKRLSGDDTLSCASCHDLARGGTDQAAVSTGIRGQKGGINAPTTFNSGFQFMQFWDGRAADLQEQAAGPPENPVEMGTTFAKIVEKLNADEAFKADFEAVYPAGISKATVTHAIAEFEKTLVTPGSRFDQFLGGKADALSADEKHGWQAFQDRGCPTCHTGRLLGGRSFEKMGRTKDYFAARGNLTAADDGRFAVTKAERDRRRFKVPTLRNIERTFPYFHDGSAADLKAAVKVMADVQVGAALPDAEADVLVAFLKTLTGTYQGKPL